jgi:hypothetical protein
MSARGKSKAAILAEAKKSEAEELDSLHVSKPPLPEDILTVRYTAVCIRACTFKGQYWPAGREYRGEDRPPAHFEITGELKKKAEAPKTETETPKKKAEAGEPEEEKKAEE